MNDDELVDFSGRRYRCPPHNFHAAFVSDEKGGAIYCRWCGEIRSLEPITIEAPAEERFAYPRIGGDGREDVSSGRPPND